MRTCLVAVTTLLSACVSVGSSHAQEPVKQLAGFFCQSPDDVKVMVGRIASGDGEGLAEMLSGMPDGVNCTFALPRATFVRAAFATIGDDDYMIFEFKDVSSGHEFYSWKRMNGAPA